MNLILSSNLWPTIAKLSKKASKRAAIAYVSSDEHLKFGDGDLLVCDASSTAIKSGQTSAAVLKRAFDRGAAIYTCSGLHAKVLLLNDKAIIGSGNASQSSANDLVEAALLTDQPAIVSRIQSFVNQLVCQCENDQLTASDLKRLLAIKVERRHFSGKKNQQTKLRDKVSRTWINGTTEIVRDVSEDEGAIEAVAEKARKRLSNPRSTVNWLRWTGKLGFRERCQADDWLIQMWRPKGRKNPQWVYQRMPVLDRAEFETATYFFYEEFPNSDDTAISWSNFTKIARRAGITRSIKPASQFRISENHADSLHALWKEV